MLYSFKALEFQLTVKHPQSFMHTLIADFKRLCTGSIDGGRLICIDISICAFIYVRIIFVSIQDFLSLIRLSIFP
jgi:hypothetical protein